MKTSNKLLISFGLTLILLPILTMAIISRVYMVQGEADRRNQEDDRSVETFEGSTRNMAKIPVAMPFSKIHIDGGSRLALDVRLIEDKSYGVKIAEEAKDLITAVVDAQGILQIVVKKPAKDQDYYRQILVYAPNIKRLNIENVTNVNIGAKQDSLEFNVNKGGSVWINEDALIKYFKGNMTDVGNFGMDRSKVGSTTLNLNNTSFTSRSSNMDYLNITTKGSSEIKIEDDNDQGEPNKVIKNLVLNTLGKTNVKIYGVKINNCSGSFSDSTQVDMPAVNINQMYKMKK